MITKDAPLLHPCQVPGTDQMYLSTLSFHLCIKYISLKITTLVSLLNDTGD
jgi:hypothetical protein